MEWEVAESNYVSFRFRLKFIRFHSSELLLVVPDHPTCGSSPPDLTYCLVVVPHPLGVHVQYTPHNASCGDIRHGQGCAHLNIDK